MKSEPVLLLLLVALYFVAVVLSFGYGKDAAYRELREEMARCLMYKRDLSDEARADCFSKVQINLKMDK